MGIKDLLKFMKPHVEPIHIKKYAGKRVGIDAYSWLHKGAYSCSMEICMDSNGDKKLRYLDYFMHRINLLRFYKITPVVVFDGASIPCKAATEQERNRRREANRVLAMEKLQQGNVDAAIELFQRAVTITPLMAHQLIKILRSEKVEFVVAPYEADAQLAYLASLEAEKGGIAAVITEDSDLLAYGCQATIFKMDRYGNGEEIVIDKVLDAVASKPSFQNFDKELFIGLCVLAGCDFLPSVPGIGIVKAHSFVSKYRNLDRVLSVLKLEKGNQVPEDYAKSFKEACAVFQHARIYDASTKKIKHMKPISPSLLDFLAGELDFLGPDLPPSIATAIAEGNVNPIDMEAFDSLPSSEYHHDPIVIQDSWQLQKLEVAHVSRQKNCSVTFSSKTTGKLTMQVPVVTEKKYLNEALALQKLILPEEIHVKTLRMVSDDIPHKISNNPFKLKSSMEEAPDDIPQKISNNPFMLKSGMEEAPIVLEDDEPNSFRLRPDDISYKTPCSSPSKKRKRNETHWRNRESIDEQVSDVTEVENLDISSIANESQESVNSKPKKISGGKGRDKKEKSKRSKSKESNQNTILNFFSRV